MLALLGVIVSADTFCFQTSLYPTPGMPGAAGSGTAKVILDTVADTIVSTVSFSGLSGDTTEAHIHGPTAVAFVTPGNVIVNYAPSLKLGVKADSFTQQDTIPTGLQDALTAGKAYVNIHTSTFLEGEILGFFTPCPTTTSFTAAISSRQGTLRKVNAESS